MSKILVVSDSHGDDQILKTILDKFANQVDLLIHTGDSEFSSDNPLVEKFNLVKGNMDFVSFPKELVLKLGDDTILVTHGHLFSVGISLTSLTLEGQEVGADMIFYGHTHELLATIENKTLIVNPGSISYPRGQYQRIGGTFAIVDVTMEKFDVQFYNRDLKPVPDLQFSFSR